MPERSALVVLNLPQQKQNGRWFKRTTARLKLAASLELASLVFTRRRVCRAFAEPFLDTARSGCRCWLPAW